MKVISVLQGSFPIDLRENEREYRLTQQQRALEREVRQLRRECIVADGLGDKEAFTYKSMQLKDKEAELKDFIEKNERTQAARVSTAGYNRSVSSKATWAVKKELQKADRSGIIKVEINGMYKRNSNNGAFSHLPERMSKKHIRELAKEYDIDLSGISITIDKNEELLNLFFTGRADSESIGGITSFPNAFKSKEELLRTLYHERLHVMQFKEHGIEFVQNNRKYFEDITEKAEDEFIDKLKKEGRL